MADLVAEIFVEEGFPECSIQRGTSLELPGYYRPEKKWDLLVVHEDALAAAIEFKSQVGPSFGNNFNNRIEEAVGSTQDLWTVTGRAASGMSGPGSATSSSLKMPRSPPRP
jgi:hypothetical protein